MTGTILKRNNDDTIHLISTGRGWILEDTSTGKVLDETSDYNVRDEWIKEYKLNRNVGQFWHKEDEIMNKRNTESLNAIFSEGNRETHKEGDVWTDSEGKTWMYREGVPDEKLDYDVNENIPDREKYHAYKMFVTKYNPENKRTYNQKGKLYPLYINAKNYYEIGPWYKCGYGASKVLIDEFTHEPLYDKNGKLKVQTYEKGLAFRPGGHAGGLPLMRHRGRKDLPHNGDNDFDYFHSQEVFAEIEFSGHYDYTDLSKKKQAESENPNDPYEAGFTDINDINTNGMGYYRFKTNTNASDDEAWFIASAFRIVRVISDDEMRKIIGDYNTTYGTDFKPQMRGAPNGKSGDKFNADFTQFDIQNCFKKRPIKSRRLNGEKVQHGIRVSDLNDATYKSGVFTIDFGIAGIKQPYGYLQEFDWSDWENAEKKTIGKIEWDDMSIHTTLNSGEEWFSTSIEEFKEDLEEIKTFLGIAYKKPVKSDVVLKKGKHGYEAWQTNKLIAKIHGFDKSEIMKHIPSYENVIESSLNLTDVFYGLLNDGYIYEEDENGLNMSYGEYAAISDYMWECVEEELDNYYDFESAYEAFQDIVNSADDDTKMYWGYSDDEDYFYFNADYDNGTYSYSGKCPDVLKDKFEEFQRNTDLERV